MRHKQSTQLGAFDLFPPDIKINVDGRSNIGTKLGSVLSVLFLGIFAGLSYLSISDYLDTKRAILSEAVVSTELEPPISFTEDKLFPLIKFQYQITKQLKPDEVKRFVTIELLKVIEYKDYNTGASTAGFIYYKTVPCSELAERGDFRSLVDDNVDQRQSFINFGICVDPNEDITLGRRSDKEPFSQIMAWRIMPCSLPSGCATREELAKVTYTPMIAKAILNLSNRKEPVKYTVVADEVRYLSTGFTSRQMINIIKTEIINDDGFLFGTSVQSKFSTIYSTSSSTSDRNPNQLSCTPEEIKLRSCIPYFIQNTINAKRQMIIMRQYKGIVETFSELGGLIDMLFLIFYFPYAFYNGRIVREFLVEKVHGISKPKKPTGPGSATAVQQSDSPAALYQQSLKEYKTHLKEADQLLDILNISRELATLKKIVKQLQSNRPSPEEVGIREAGDAAPDIIDVYGDEGRSGPPKHEKKQQPAVASKSSLKVIKPQQRPPLTGYRAASTKNLQSAAFDGLPLDSKGADSGHRQIEPIPLQPLDRPSFETPPQRSIAEFV